MNKNRLIIWVAIIYQAVLGGMLLLFPKQINVASLGLFHQLFPIVWIGAVLKILAAFLALIGLYKTFAHKILQLTFFVPQQFFLTLNAGSALTYIITQRYADGVIRGWPFILADQLLILIFTVVYAIVALQPITDGGSWKQQS